MYNCVNSFESTYQNKLQVDRQIESKKQKKKDRCAHTHIYVYVYIFIGTTQVSHLIVRKYVRLFVYFFFFVCFVVVVVHSH